MGCQRCMEVLRLILSVLALLTGISVAITFYWKYQNYHTSAWALVTSFFALLALVLHSKYEANKWRDGGNKLLYFTGVGILGQITTIISILAFLVIAISEEQKLTPYGPRAFYLTSIWIAMSWKWAFLTTLYSIRYRRLLLNSMFESHSINGSTETDFLISRSSSGRVYTA